VAERVPIGKAAALDQHQFLEPLEEIVVVADVLAAAQRHRGDGIGARRAADAEIDAARKQRLQGVEAFRHRERRMVGQHDATGADADARRRRRDLADHDVRRRTRHRRQAMMLGDPVAGVAEPVGKPGEIDAVAQCGRARPACGHRREIEDGCAHGAEIIRGRLVRNPASYETLNCENVRSAFDRELQRGSDIVVAT
jgi:hypothetical protein